MVKRWDILTEVDGALKAGVFVLASDYDKARDIIRRLCDVRVGNLPSDEAAALDAIYRDITALDPEAK